MDTLPDPLLFSLFEGLPRKGPGSAASTERACRYIDRHLHLPLILDIGCGSGASALVLARLSRGEVVAGDLHRPFLRELRAAAAAGDTGRRITPLQATMDRLPFREGTFDAIWSEGAIFIMGFWQGLRSRRPFLKESGFLAVTELTWLVDDAPEEARRFFAEEYHAMATDAANRRVIRKEGYRLLDAFPLPETAWCEEYYAPLGKRVREIRNRGGLSPGQEEILALTEREIDMYERYSSSYGSVMYVMQKTGSSPQ